MTPKTIEINKETFIVNENEFQKLPHDEFNNLIILDDLSFFEKLSGFLCDLVETYESKFNLIITNLSHGGFLPINLSSFFHNIYVKSIEDQNYNFLKNKKLKSNLFLFEELQKVIISSQVTNNFIILNNDENLILQELNYQNAFFILSLTEIENKNQSFAEYKLENYFVYVKLSENAIFLSNFHFYLQENILHYDNLLHLTMIVKNAGDNFENILKENLQFFDRWTILDTGSTDNTIEIINRVLVGKKKGKLFQEPFINFRDSRNRCLDLAGQNCKFIVMIDDTYILKKNIRKFLETVRGDQFSDSFSLYIQSHDTEYGSNRIIKSATNLRYKYKLHEVITPKNNMNVIIPIHHAHILDFRSDYMEKRTMDRKQYDLKILYEMVEEEPDDSRALYYLGQTYNLLEEHEKAFEFFLKRVEHPDEGFIQEKIDACFEAARISNFKLNKPWEISEKLYLRAYEMDKSRPDSIYFLGIHHYLEGNYKKAFEYMKLGFEIGYPAHCQYSLKPTLSFYYLPKFLTELAFRFRDFILGEKSADLFLNNYNEETSFNKDEYYTVKCWKKIHYHVNKLYSTKRILHDVSLPEKPVVVFHVDGGFEPWTGKDILTKGVGGSETFIIEIARYIQQSGLFHVYVFCNCNEDDIFENVHYKKLSSFNEFALNTKIQTVIVSRYPEYLPSIFELPTENVKDVYLILHDLIPNGEIVIDNEKLRNIFLLSNFHKDFFDNMFPTLQYKTKVFGYGIDDTLFHFDKKEKKPLKFIYSSFAHRGLLQLLQLWKKIISKYPNASLHIHCDITNKWLNNVVPKQVEEIKKLLSELLQNPSSNIIYHGWTSKKKLAENYASADILLYPTNFIETFCLTALEAAISKTLVVTSNIGALNDTVSNERGILIDVNQYGNSLSETYQERILQELFDIIENQERKTQLVETNYLWAKNLSWKNRAIEFIKNYL